VHSTADVIALLRQKYYHPSALTPASAAAGMRLSELRESFPPARDVIEELVNEQPPQNRQVLALRNKRDGAIRHVFWNPIQGDIVKPIDAEFRELWHGLQVPNVVDLASDLESEGLTATKMYETAPKNQVAPAPAQRGKKGRRGAAPRKFKLQNTHLKGVDLSKDFVKPG
jgi:hypothetical protein